MNRAQLELINGRALKRRDEYLRALADGTADPNEWHTLKHTFPFYGHIDCRFGEASIVMYSANDDVVAWELFWTGQYESATVDLWMALAATAEVALDIGAYTGCMAIAAASQSSDLIVHAFEAMPRTAERFAINSKLNQVSGRCHLHAAAVSDESGIVTMNLPRPTDFLGTGNSVFKKPHIATISTIDVVRARVDDLLGDDQEGRVGVIKLDVEGHEMEAIRGMTGIIERHRPTMIVEVWPHEKQALSSYFADIDYVSRHIEGMNWLWEPR